MAVSEKLKSLVDQMPDADNRGMYTTDIDKKKIEKAVAAIYEGGPENMRGLIAMLSEPGSPKNVKPHYALHCVVNYALVTKDEPGRKAFCEVMAAELGGDSPKHIQAYLCQELQWAGRAEAVAALGSVLTDEDLTTPASMALVAIGGGVTGDRAAEQLRKAFPKAKGLARLNVVHSLAALADKSSAGIFKEAIKDSDREVRLAAGSGSARIGDATAVRPLIEAAQIEPGWERIQATKHCFLLAERLVADGKKDAAHGIYRHIRATRKAPGEAYLREAAEKSLATV